MAFLFDDILSSVLSIFTDLSKDKILTAINQKELELAVKAAHRQYFETKFQHLTLQQEFDFEGLTNFLTQSIFNQMYTLLTCTGIEEHKIKKSNLLEDAVAYAQPTTTQGKYYVEQYTLFILNLVKTYFINLGDTSIIVNSAVNELNQMIELSMQEQMELMHQLLSQGDTFANLIDNIAPRPVSDDPFNYMHPGIKLHGREKEIELLDQFMKDPRTVLFTCITGDGGSGKSKLMHCYTESCQPIWRTIFCGEETLNKLLHFDNFAYGRPLLIVVDYAARVSKEVGNWLARLSDLSEQALPKKLRIVLLERDGAIKKESKNNTLNDILLPIWYQELIEPLNSTHLKNYLYCLQPGETFYELPTPSDSALAGIITDYAEINKKKIDADEIQKILSFVASMVSQPTNNAKVRPLFVLFAAGAYLDGQAYHKWNLDKLMEYVVKRHRAHWKLNLCHYNNQVYDALELLVLYATATVPWEIGTDLPSPFNKTALIEEFVHYRKDKIFAFLNAINHSNTSDDKLHGLEPDLVGEYFVLSYFDNLLDTHLNKIATVLWQEPQAFSGFLIRCIQNLHNESKFKVLLMNPRGPLYWNGIPNYLGLVFLYQTITALPEDRGAFVCELSELHNKDMHNHELAVLYARSLFVLTIEKDLAGRQETVQKLEQLLTEYPGNLEITIQYAKGLVNLSSEQDLAGRQETIQRLEQLLTEYPGSLEIATEYAKGLVNLSSKQDLAGRQETIQRLEQLLTEYPGNLEITIPYANGLVNLSSEQDLAGSQETIQRLEQLLTEYPGNLEIATIYANGLFNLSCEQDLAGIQETVQKLEQLLTDYPGKLEITIQYAKGLVNLSAKQDLAGRQETVQKLEQLLTEYPGNFGITIQYANGLANLSDQQELAGRQETVQKIKQLVREYPDLPAIVSQYAIGLVNLSEKQNLAGRQQTAHKLIKLNEQWIGRNDTLASILRLSIQYVESNSEEERDTLEKQILNLVESFDS